MAINPITSDFVSGAVLTAAQMNRLPRGVLGYATSSTSYTLTTSPVIATGMTLTLALASARFLKITYIEPQAGTPNVAGGFTTTTIKLTSAAGTQLSQGVIQTPSAASIGGSVINSYINIFSASTYTFVGCGATSSVSGAPVFTRSATNLAMLLIEDLGPG